jgi:TonB family protein
MPTGVKVPLTFNVFGPAGQRSQTLSQDIIKIGKASSSHLQIDDESVSRMHAVVEVSIGDDGKPQVQIIDLGSKEGTFVNDQKVNKTILKDHDTIRIGAVKVVLDIGKAEALTPSAAAMGAPPPIPGAPPIAQPAPPLAPLGPPLGGLAAASALAAPLAPLPMGQVALTPGMQRALMNPDAVEVRDGSQAIEVTALFGDSVLDVKHYSDPKATGKVSNGTKIMRVVGLAMLLLAVVCFGMQLSRSAADANAANAHDQNKDVPYTPATPMQGLEWAWLLSLLSGAIILTTASSRALGEKSPRHFRIGTATGAEFNVPPGLVPETGEGGFPLVHSTGHDFEVLVTPQMRGDLTEGTTVTPIADLISGGRVHGSGEVPGAYALRMPPSSRLKVDLGENTFLLSAVPPPRKHPKAFDLDWGFMAYLGGTFLGAIVLVLLMFSIPPDSKTLSGSGDDDAAQYAKYLVKPPEEKPEDTPQQDTKTGADDPGGKGKRAAGTEGKMGNKNAPDTGHKYGIKGPADNQDLHMAKVYAEQEAQQAGVLGWLNGNQGVHGPTSVFGQDTALGNDAEDALGNLMGDTVGDALGAGGLGLSGTGNGGGGTGEGTIGLGNFGTIGHGGGGGDGQGYGTGAGTLGGRKNAVPDVQAGVADVQGALDKDIIRRVIRYHQNEIKFCYDQELQKNQNLAGTVAVAFTISGDGNVIVASVVESVGDATVDNCIAEVIRRCTFPKPQGGGIVNVTRYPFVLKAD